jgi:hypothetical protein
MTSEWLGIVADIWGRAPIAAGCYVACLVVLAVWLVVGAVRCYRCK